ncbi:MAG: hypothetical protein ACYDEY_10255 [Acidimicrobiales bacterium]
MPAVASAAMSGVLDSGEASETFTLITTLFDPAAAPGEELAELYRDRT